MVWVDPKALPDLRLAPLTRDHVLPLARGLEIVSARRKRQQSRRRAEAKCPHAALVPAGAR
jgi:hypothetical protein